MTREDRPIQVLLVEDDEDDYVLTRDLLERTDQPFELDWAASYAEGLAAICRAEHDLYLVDYRLGPHDAADLLRAARAPATDRPYIVFTAAGGRETDLAAMGAGADDFLVKGQTTPEMLERAIRYALERRRLMRQLREAEKTEMLMVLAGGIAHDFNNLLTTILGYAQLGAAEIPHDAAGDAFDEISRAGMRAAELTRQLLAYAGHARSPRRRLDVVASLTRMRDDIAALLPGDARLELATSPAAPLVLLGEDELRRIVEQLVRNAVEALRSESRGVRIEADALALGARELATYRHGPARPSGSYLRLAVCDDGAGMAPETAARAFDPFFSTRFPGRGLGLAAVDGIVRVSGGAIRLAGEPGRGTTVEIALPAAAPEARPLA